MVIKRKFSGRIAKIVHVQSYRLHGCSALLDPFGFATALASYFATLVLQPIEKLS